MQNFSRLSARGRAGFLTAAVLVGTVGLSLSAAAQETHYSDVPTGAYYEGAAAALLEMGALDSGEARLRPSDLATRAEMIKLLVFLNNRDLEYPSVSSFNDVSTASWYFPYVEAAATAGWIKGDKNCYQQFRPCMARPAAGVNRAEAATILVRAFALERTGKAPQFTDNPSGQWYYDNIQIAADHCVLQGDGGTGRVRPAAGMNRAEMVVMFYRASQDLEYGVDCGTPITNPADLTGATVTANNRVRLTFDTDISATRAEDESRYTVERVGGGGTVGVSTATAINNRTVELQLSGTLSSNASYRVSVNGLMTSGGTTFSDSVTFTSQIAVTGNLDEVVSLSSTRVRLTFNTQLDGIRAEQTNRYEVEDGSRSLGIRTANLLDDGHTVELSLTEALKTQHVYTVNVQQQLTEDGTFFSDSAAFVYDAGGLNFSATLEGAQEVPPVVTTASGTGSFILTENGLQYDITLRNLSGSLITGAHFHLADRGISGSVVHPITFSGNRSTGTWTGMSNEHRQALLDRLIYVNVHTPSQPDGEIRGQVLVQ